MRTGDFFSAFREQAYRVEFRVDPTGILFTNLSGGTAENHEKLYQDSLLHPEYKSEALPIEPFCRGYVSSPPIRVGVRSKA
jgi:hypothetical protein